MIIVLSTRSHRYTHRVLTQEAGLHLRVLPYDSTCRRRHLPAATYVFTDLDRLSDWELELAAFLYRQLREAGLRVLNDPAKVSQRFKLLRQLKEAGINAFDAWTCNDVRRPNRFPVFLRTASAHRGVLTDLIEDEGTLEEVLAAAVARGVPQRDLLVVEYCAEPLEPGLFRKLSVFRVGAQIISTTCVHDSKWVAKSGVKGIASQVVYDDEFRIVRDNPYGDALRTVFETGHIDYGRADFGLVGGRAQIYEINTNPSIERPGPHPFAIRIEASVLAYGNLVSAFAALDADASARSVDVALHPMLKIGRWPRWVYVDRGSRP